MKGKNYNLELVRMVSFILVIVIHVTNYFCRAYGHIPRSEYLFSLVMDTAARISVPCFFMISGALLLGREESLQKHGARILRFLLVLGVWSAVYYLWNRLYMGTPYDLTHILYEPVEAHLWYLYAMIPIYLVLPFIQVMIRGMKVEMERIFLAVTTGAVVVYYLMWLAGQEPYYDMPLVGDRIYLYYLFLGYYLYKYKEHIQVSQTVLILICVMALTAVFVTTLGVTLMEEAHYEGALTYANPFLALASGSFFLLMLRLGEGSVRLGEVARKIVDLFCNCSFGIYLIHILFLDHYKKHMKPWDLSAWIAVPVLTLGIAAASVVCVWIIRRCGPGRRIM